jgi:hypothetical protein
MVLSTNIVLGKNVDCVSCPIHVVTFTLISNLVADYIQKRRGESGLFSYQNWYQSKNDYMDRASYCDGLKILGPYLSELERYTYSLLICLSNSLMDLKFLIHQKSMQSIDIF